MAGGRIRRRIAALCALMALLAIVPAAQATIATQPQTTWQTNGRVNAILQIGGITYVGGKFTQIFDHAGNTRTVSNLAAFNASGTFTGWAPNANGTVKDFATDGTGAVIAGGSFTQINGSGRPHVAKILANGTLVAKTTFAAEADGDVQALAVSGNTLYMGGQFANVDGHARAFLGAVGLMNGAFVSPWAPFVDGRVDGLEAVGSNIVAGGFFLNAGSASGGHPSIAAFDATTGALQSGYTGHTPSAVVAMTVGADGSIYTGHFNNRMQRFTPTGGSSWQIGFDGNVQAIGISDGEVIAGGHFQNICDVGTNCTNPIVRNHLAAFDPSSGTLDTTWAPSVNSDLGVFALADTSAGLAVGGDFTRIGGLDQEHLAFLQTGNSVPVDSTPPTVSPLPDAILRKATTITSGKVPALVRWGATDASGICSYALQANVNGGAFAGISLPSQMATTHAVNLLSSANTHLYEVQATDCVGNATAFRPGPSVRLTAFQDVNAGIRYTAAWARGNAPDAFGDTVHSTSRSGASATFKFTGRQVAWVATRRANRGTAHVYLDGKLVANVNLHSASVMHRRIVFAHAWAADGAHTIKIVCAGTAGHATVDVDAFVTIR
jgi:Domain of unknown function (DUF5122) beta-propeller